MSDVQVNTRRTLADLGMRDSARGLSYGCAIRGFVHADNAPLPQSSPPHDFGSELGRAAFAACLLVYVNRDVARMLTRLRAVARLST